MALTADDLNRIVKYRAFSLGDSAGGPLTWQSVMQLIQNQINFVNAQDTRFGTDVAGLIQADLDQMDADDAAQTAAAGQAGLKRVDVIEYFQSGSTVGYSANIERLRLRVAAMLSQTYSPMMAAGTSELGRG
jgi:hypothetical protein